MAVSEVFSVVASIADATTDAFAVTTDEYDVTTSGGDDVLSGGAIAYDQIYEVRVADAMWRYVSPVIIALGTVGNCLSAAVMCRKALRSSTTSFYLICLAVTDTLVLYSGLLRYWIRTAFDVDVRALTGGSCKVHVSVVYFAFQYQAWLLVNVSLERLIAVFLPTRHKLLFTRARAAAGVTITAAVLLLVNAHWYAHQERIVADSGAARCGNKEGYARFMSVTWPWIDMALASLAPFVVMIAINIAIAVRLFRASQQARRGQSGVKMTTMTAMLLCVSVLFLLTTSPICVYLIAQPQLFARATTYQDWANIELAWATVNMLAYLNNMINFCLYCLTGRRFRIELMRMFGIARVAPMESLSRTLTHPKTATTVT